jgi:hypothetical protein
MEEKKIGNIKKISKSTTRLIFPVLIGMIASLISNLAVFQFNSNTLIAFGILIMIVAFIQVAITILKRRPSKVFALKNSLKEAYINAIDHSDLNPDSRKR